MIRRVPLVDAPIILETDARLVVETGIPGARMSGRFAGAERLGDRRRRRLALNPEGSPATAPEAPPGAAAGCETGTRPLQIRIDAPAESDQPQIPALPMAHLVPLAVWKYLLAAVALVAAVCGLRYAAQNVEAIAHEAGPGVARLFDPKAAPVETAVSAMLLLVAAQLGALIAWGRSRSSRDFSGRYRVWVRISACCAFFSFVTATSAHVAWVETVVFFFPREVWRREIVLWLVPVALIAAGCGSAIRWEVARSRTSLCLLFLTTAMYTLAAVCHLEVDSVLTPQLRQECTATLVLLGHVTLVFCFWLHARFVLYFCADPVELPRRSVRAPFFSLFRTRRGEAADATADADADTDADSDSDDEDPAEGRTPARSKRGGKRRSRKARVTPRRELRVDPACSPDSPDLVDETDELAGEPLGNRELAPVEAVEPRGAFVEPKPAEEESSHAALVKDEMSEASPIPPEWESESVEAERATKPPPSQERNGFPELSEISEPRAVAHDHSPDSGGAGDDDDDVREGLSEVNLKGLSKKQRRKMQQQMRERERQMHRR